MKCEASLEFLEEYFDGELPKREADEVAAHLMTCASCSAEGAALTAEQEMFSRYDRELEVPPSMWVQIAESAAAPIPTKPVSNNGFAALVAGLFRVPALGFSMAGVAVLIVIAILIAGAYVRVQRNKQDQRLATLPVPLPPESPRKDDRVVQPQVSNSPKPDNVVAFKNKPRVRRVDPQDRDQSDVVSTDLGYQDLEDVDTAKHLEQTQNLFRSIRNVQLNDTDQEIDVSYDKALSRRLLNENIVLRRDAEMNAKFPAKTLLSDLEPFLIDIANLPDHAKSEEIRVIKERVQKTEIVAALIGY